MGKRKNSDKEEYIARKIKKKLERKMAKVRRGRRRISSSSESSDAVQSEAEMVNASVLDHVPELEVEPIEEPRQENVEPVVEPDAQPEPELELDPSILSILGDEPAKEEVFSKAIHRDIASRWSDILTNGLNPEIKASVNENAVKRDAILSEKQKHLACIITCIAELMSSALENRATFTDSKETLKLLSDAGRLLCHVHYSESSARKTFLLACLNKDIKDNIKDLKRDRLLFGTDLSEKLKCIKAINKTGVEMRPAAAKVKPQPKNKQPEASTSRALNWRGPPPPAPRRGFTRPSSTAGGRKQPTTTIRGSGRRDPKLRNKTSRR